MRLAIASGLFPLYEVFGGRTYRINVRPDWSDPADYFSRQHRFPADAIDLDAIGRQCRQRFVRLEALAERHPHAD